MQAHLAVLYLVAPEGTWPASGLNRGQADRSLTHPGLPGVSTANALVGRPGSPCKAAPPQVPSSKQQLGKEAPGLVGAEEVQRQALWAQLAWR